MSWRKRGWIQDTFFVYDLLSYEEFVIQLANKTTLKITQNASIQTRSQHATKVFSNKIHYLLHTIWEGMGSDEGNSDVILFATCSWERTCSVSWNAWVFFLSEKSGIPRCVTVTPEWQLLKYCLLRTGVRDRQVSMKHRCQWHTGVSDTNIVCATKAPMTSDTVCHIWRHYRGANQSTTVDTHSQSRNAITLHYHATLSRYILMLRIHVETSYCVFTLHLNSAPLFCTLTL